MRRIFLILVLLILHSFTVTEGFAFLSPVTVVASVWGTTQLPQTVEPGTTNNPLTVYIQNYGTTIIYNVTVKLNLNNPFSSQSNASSITNIVTIIPPSGNAATTFYLNIDRRTTKGVYPLNIELTYSAVGSDFDKIFTLSLPITTSASLIVQSALWGSPTTPATVTQGTRNALLVLSVKNVGDNAAYNSSVTLHLATPFRYEAEGSNGSETAQLGVIPSGGVALAQFTVSIESSVATGLYPLTATLVYNNISANQRVYVPITGSASPTVQSVIWGSITNPVPISPGTTSATLFLNVKNAGDSPATNVTATIKLSKPFSYIAGGPKSTESTQLGVIPAGSISPAQFTVNINPDIPTGLYPLNVTITYNNGALVSQLVYIPVLGYPKVVMQSYAFQAGNIFPGDTYVALTVGLINSGNATARDVSTELKLPPQLSAFYPGATSMTLGQLPPSTLPSTVKFTLNVPKSIPTPLNLNLTLNVSYNGIDKTYIIPVTVSSFASFVESPTKGPSMVQGDTDIPMSLVMTNNGNSTAKSVQAQLLLPNELSGNTFTYLGDMTSKASNIATYNLDVDGSAAPGTYYGTVQVTWLQDNAPGRQFTQDLPISFTINRSLTNQIESDFMGPITIVAIIVIVALVVIGIIMIRRKR